MRLGEKKAKEALERILKDLNRKYNVNLVVDRRTFNVRLKNGRYVDSMSISIARPGALHGMFIPLMQIAGKVSYVKLLNKLIKFGLLAPSGKYQLVDVSKLYGNTYEQIMMNLDMHDIE